MAANAASSNKLRVWGERGQQTVTMSHPPSISWKRSMPQSCDTSSHGGTSSTSTARTSMPNALARLATERPVPPRPTIPIVAPLSSNITLRMEGRLGQLFGASSVARLSWRESVSSKPKAWSARCSPTRPLSPEILISLATISGYMSMSAPAAVECSQRRLRASGNVAWSMVPIATSASGQCSCASSLEPATTMSPSPEAT